MATRKNYTDFELQSMSIEELERLNREASAPKQTQSINNPKVPGYDLFMNDSETQKYYVKYNSRLSTIQLNQEKSKHNFKSIKHATKGTGAIPSADNLVIISGDNINIEKIKMDTNVI